MNKNRNGKYTKAGMTVGAVLGSASSVEIEKKVDSEPGTIIGHCSPALATVGAAFGGFIGALIDIFSYLFTGRPLYSRVEGDAKGGTSGGDRAGGDGASGDGGGGDGPITHFIDTSHQQKIIDNKGLSSKVCKFP